MAEKSSINVGGGVTFGQVLFITFLVLKLTHVIDWSWWWVTAPLWAVFALIVALFLLAGLLQLVVILIDEFWVKPQRKKRRSRKGLR